MSDQPIITEYQDFKKTFNGTEWKILQFSIFWVFNAVARADGKIDKKEIDALSHLMKNSSAIINELARDVVASIEKDFHKIKSDFDSDKREIIDGMREVSDLLNVKVNQKTAVNFKKTLLGIGFYIANASGKWIGSKVSAEESIAIKLAGLNLRLTAAQLEEVPSINEIFNSFDEK
jgi:tellurite resistance protein